MWDQLRRVLRGRVSLQKWLLMFSSLAIAILSGTQLLANPALAADVTRNGDSVSYQGVSYTRIDKTSFSTDNKTKNLPISGYDGYKTENGSTLYLILTNGDASKATSGQFVTYTLKNGVYDASTQSQNKTVSIANSSSSSTSSDSSGSSSSSTSDSSSSSSNGETCTIDQVGWFVCPATTFLADRMDNVMDILKYFLTVHTLQTDLSNNPVYEIWQKVRDIANICFIIIFLIIVYSQITNVGFSNHSLKVMIPRLIIAAILVNISYWLSGALVDISNVLGVGVQQFFTDVRNSLHGYSQLGSDLGWAKLTATVLAGGGTITSLGISSALSAGGIGGALTLLIPTLVGVLLAAVVAMIILAARQALITLCILISPLAFVAYVLPSTNKFFDKWKDLFLTMLLMFPMVAFVFGAAQLAGYAIIANAGDSPIQIIIGLAVQVAPIAVTPFLIRISGSVLGKIAGIVNNPKRGIVDRTRNWAEDRVKYQKARNFAGRPLIDKNGRLTNNALTNRSEKIKNAADKAANSINRAHGSRFAKTVSGRNAAEAYYRRQQRRQGLTSAYEAMAANRATDADNKQFKDSSVRMMSGIGDVQKKEVENAFYGSRHGQNLEARSRSADINKSELDNVFDRSHHDITRRQQLAEIDRARTLNEFNETSAGREVDTARRTVEAQKSIIGNDQQAAWDKLATTDPTYKALNLEMKGSEFNAAKAKAKLEKMNAEVVAKGSDSEHVLNLRGVNAATQDHVIQIAHDMKNANIEANLASSAKQAAERALASDINSMMLDNKVSFDGKLVREYAAGIGSESSVLAEYVAKSRKEAAEQIAEQSELAHHFKLDAGQVEALATGKLFDKNKNPIRYLTVKDSEGREYKFDKEDEFVREMAVDEIFKVGSHNQKMNVVKLTGAKKDAAGNIMEKGYNYDLRRSVQQAVISSKFTTQAPALGDKSLNAILNGDFFGDESWQYNSYREILEGRLKTSILSSTNANSLKRFFIDIDSDNTTRDSFEKLISDGISGEQDKLREALGRPVSAGEARQSLIDKFNKKRFEMYKMAKQILETPTIRQNMADEAVNVMKEFIKEMDAHNNSPN